MKRRKRGRRRDQEAEALAISRIEKIDRFLSRFYESLATEELKLADYMRLADLDSIAAGDGDEEVTVRWVSYEEETD